MIPVPASIRAKFNSMRREQPMLVAAIFADAGASDSLATLTRMQGKKDPASVSDVSVQVLADTAELMLAPGAAAPLNQTTTPLPAAYSSEWRMSVTDNYYWQGHGYFYSATYQHVSYITKQLANQTPIAIPFTASGSCTVNDIRLQLGNTTLGTATPMPDAAVGNSVAGVFANIAAAPAIMAGGSPQALTAYLRFVDVGTNNQVGNSIAIAMTGTEPMTTRVISGFSAALSKGTRYALEVSYTTPTPAALGYAQCVAVQYFARVVVGGFSLSGIPPLWGVPLAAGGGGIPMGGVEGYQPGGIAWRSLDVCAHGSPAPTGYGTISVSDVVPAQTTLAVFAWATNNAALYAAAGVSGWVSIGQVQSGDAAAPYRYWRFKLMMISTPARDDTPRLDGLSVSYTTQPVVLGTHAQAVKIPDHANTYTATAIKALNKLTSSTSALEPKLKTIMVGQFTLELSPEPAVLGLFSRPLRGKRVLIRAGYADVAETMLYADCIVRDLAYSGGRYILTILDPLELADVSIPRNRWAAWVSTTAYAAGTTVTFGNKSYLALSANTGTQPDLFPAVWQDAGSVYVKISYPNGMHLCDVAADALTNQVNIPSERLDQASLDTVKALRPNRQTTGRNLANPEKAIDILSDIAWLTESYWTMRGGKLALIAEASATAAPVMTITPDDIKETLNYRRGWADMKNECLIFTQYLGTGQGNEQYQNAIGVADATSIADYALTAVHEFKDKWNLPAYVLTYIASQFVARWKNGRRIVRVDASMRLLPIETGEVVLLKSAQLPSGDVTQIKAIVMQKDLDWMAQSIQLTMMEI